MDSNILNVKRKADDETADEVKNHHQPKRNKGNSDTTMNKSVLEEKDRARRSAVLEEIRASGQQVSDARFQREIEDAQLRVLQNLERDGRVRLVASRMHYYTDFWVWCSRCRFPFRQSVFLVLTSCTSPRPSGRRVLCQISPPNPGPAHR
jgi:hypothetical protein